MAGLDRAMLADLGICASAAEYEASRPFWDMPRAVQTDAAPSAATRHVKVELKANSRALKKHQHDLQR
jgi:hypothetical protein